MDFTPAVRAARTRHIRAASRQRIGSALGFAALLFAPAPLWAQDGDGDGVPDAADAFPCDPSLAGVAFAPAEGESALILMEDQWPSRGDLDFNDVVLGYHYEYRLDPAGGVVGLTATIDVLALGGIYDNGLGLQLPVAAASVASVTRQVGSGPAEALALSAQDANFTVRISANLREVFGGRPGQINSTREDVRLPGGRIVLEVSFADPVGLAPGDAPHDVYLFRSHDPAHEIHLPIFRGTANMRESLFGSADDGSSAHRRFVDTSGLPFVLVLPIDNPYPQEGIAISELFPQIIHFAASGGATHRDFYVSGVQEQHAYRDATGARQLGPDIIPPFAADRSCVADQCLGDDGSGTLTCGLGACQVTVEACEDGVPVTCEPLDAAEPEICDGIDNDCDGEVDEDCDCIDGQTQSCWSGSPELLGVGICSAGTQTCAGGRWGACQGQVLPRAELCNNLDDDCDGNIDQGFPILTCGIGECFRAVESCVEGVMLACVPGAPEAELCDGLDNDCNGLADDGAASNACNSYANSTSACVDGECVLSSCAEGFTDCDGIRNNGCEVNVLTHARNCGACGNRCPTGHGCADGACVCIPRTCAEVCGTVPDGCGGTVSCPSCRGLSVSAGPTFTCGLRSNGTVQCWGRNLNGQLGDGTNNDRFYPVLVDGIMDAIAVSAGEGSACALLADGTVRCWGANGSGQLGDGSTTASFTPVQVEGLIGATAVSVGRLHACAVLEDETVWCWGLNSNGQLGDGSTTLRTTPVQVAGLSGAVAVAAGYNFSCATLGDGTARCWGNNANGQLGDNSTTQRTLPVTVSGLANATDVRVASRGYHACAVLADRTVRCWGRNANGQLGDGTTTQRNLPVTPTSVSAVAEIALGASHSCVRQTSGAVRCWGLNTSSQLGDGTVTQRTTSVAVTGVSGASGLAAGNTHTCVSLTSGAVQCFGANTWGELGDQTDYDRSTAVATYAFPCDPTTCAEAEVYSGTISNGCGQTVRCGQPQVRLASGNGFSCALRSDGTVDCWGRNTNGQLGDGTLLNRYQPTRVHGISSAVSVVAGEQHACALLANGSVRCWGLNTSGQLGDGTTAQRTRPAEVEDLVDVVAIAAGRLHTCARLGDGTARCWGNNGSGRLGDGTSTNRLTPVPVVGLDRYLEVVAITAGTSHTCAVLSGGTVRCWGYNGYGELGDGSTSSRTTPVVAGTLADAIDVQAGWGSNHTCALLAGGGVRCWGRGTNGQLGDAGTSNRTSPVVVSGITTAVEISVGTLMSCARLSNNTVRCWGLNTSGQLGDGTVTQRTTPVTVTGLGGVAGLAAGGTHACAMMADGSVQCWGSNSLGELGDQTTYQRSTAAPVHAFPCRPATCASLGVTSGTVSNGCGGTLQCGAAPPRLAEGLNFSCAVRPTGAVQCWGRNNYGQLGDGTTTNRFAPVSVAGISNAVGVTAGESHACAVLATGQLRCWGRNNYGQIGDGTTSTRLAPVAVSGITDAIQVSAGRLHTCARLTDGTARCWGHNGNYKLGDRTTTTRTTPVNVLGLEPYLGVVDIVAGNVHTCALLSGGTVRCWGSNTNGQIGHGGTTTSPANNSTPQLVDNISSVVELVAGSRGWHNCARLANGQVWCWGRNSNGQIGDNTITNRTRPVLLTFSGVTVTQLSAGAQTSCARLSTGATRCWGLNASGQLGDGTLLQRRIPTATQLPATTTFIAAGDTHSCAQANDGTVRCFGNNLYGELGDQTVFNRATPAPVYAFPCVPTSCGASGVGEGSLPNGCGVELQCGTTLSRIGAGSGFSCALGAGGTVECWGRNQSGQLGDGTNIGRNYPARVLNVAGARSVVAGEAHACALFDDGSVGCWGQNNSGQLGDGTNEASAEPVPVSGIFEAVEIAAGRQHTCARLRDGTVRCWGLNSSYQLGDGTTTARWTPVPMNGLTSHQGVISVTAGYAHTCVLLAGGMVRCVGGGGSGQMGDGGTSNRSAPVAAGTLSDAVMVRAGSMGDHTCALRANGQLLCWGRGANGQIGDGGTANRTVPTVVALSGVVDLDLGYRHTCARLSGGGMRCWGLNGSGQLGDGSVTQRTTPVTVSSVSGASDLATGNGHSCALLTGGEVRCWGSNGFGELGDLTDNDRATPVATYAFPCQPLSCGDAGMAFGTMSNGCGQTIQCGSATPRVAGGQNFSCGVQGDGSVWCWGRNNFGQLGEAGGSSSSAPLQIGGLQAAVGVVAGEGHACAHLADGTVSCWGLNTSGQLGDGTTESRSAPARVEGLSGVAALTAGRLHTCARLLDGTAWCWGNNANGRLGDVSTTNRSVPVQVQGLESFRGVIGITAGFGHTCALLTGGLVRCWGLGSNGQLGNGATGTSYTTAQAVSGLEGVVEVAAASGGYHTCARLTDGTVRCWGRNTNGQIGDGTTTQRTTPVVVSSLSGVAELALGASQSCARLSSGALRCWGLNSNGELGDGSVTQRTAPVAVSGITNAASLAAGSTHGCALRTTGALACWGSNGFGELGDGTETGRTTPVVVVIP